MIELGFDCANEEELQVQEDTNYYEWCALRTSVQMWSIVGNWKLEEQEQEYWQNGKPTTWARGDTPMMSSSARIWNTFGGDKGKGMDVFAIYIFHPSSLQIDYSQIYREDE
jgi:hypothetical protein